MIKQLKFILPFITSIGLQLDAATTYSVGVEADGKRTDSILMGSAGGFNGFLDPSEQCRELYINLAISSSEPAPNINPTNSYTGTGTLPYLPTTLKHVYIYGDPTYYNTMVLGNTVTGPSAPIYPPAAYALPTPAPGTFVHFSLSKPPASSPLTWFQGPLPENCKLVIELKSADPFINTMLPLAGGSIIIGAPVTFFPGFSALLNSAGKPVAIQRHPDIDPNKAREQAVITLTETTIFAGPFVGASLSGAFPSTFNKTSEIIDPTAEAATAGFTVATGEQQLSIYSHNFETLPAINSYIEPGGTSAITIAKKPARLPITSVLPNSSK